MEVAIFVCSRGGVRRLQAATAAASPASSSNNAMAGGGGVLERELLGAASARARLQQQQRQRGEEANLILQLGTVVTSTSSLADHVIDSPPNSDPGLQGLAAAAATVQRSHVPRSITE
ncbi:hypothetical protein B566_EDAN009704 [Ephemera danica]|nr:hypothetical protein B566_EDAN009704 [Ephemera danica]